MLVTQLIRSEFKPVSHSQKSLHRNIAFYLSIQAFQNMFTVLFKIKKKKFLWHKKLFKKNLIQ